MPPGKFFEDIPKGHSPGRETGRGNGRETIHFKMPLFGKSWEVSRKRNRKVSTVFQQSGKLREVSRKVSGTEGTHVKCRFCMFLYISVWYYRFLELFLDPSVLFFVPVSNSISRLMKILQSGKFPKRFP